MWVQGAQYMVSSVLQHCTVSIVLELALKEAMEHGRRRQQPPPADTQLSGQPYLPSRSGHYLQMDSLPSQGRGLSTLVNETGLQYSIEITQ
jgi:hypothetical protein